MQLVLIAHNIRSTHNIGSILRTADGFGVTKVFMTGYTPYPQQPGDARLPHLRQKITAQIHKTALGAEQSVMSEHRQDVGVLLRELKQNGFRIVGLEQANRSIPLPQFKTRTAKLGLLLGEEVHGITPELLELCDDLLEIPMHGNKESFNVSVATGIALYQLREHAYTN